MSYNYSYMQSPSEKKNKTKMQVTLQQQQTQSYAVDLKNSQVEMNSFFGSQSNLSFSNDKNNKKFQQSNRPSTKYIPNHLSDNPLKDSQASCSNHSPHSNNSRKYSFHQFNQSISKKNLNKIPQGSITPRARISPSFNQGDNNDKKQNYQTVPNQTGSITNRTGHINSTPDNRITDGSQNNPPNPQSQQYINGPNYPQQTYQHTASRQTNLNRSNSISTNPLAQENDQLKQNLTKLQNQLRIQKDKNIYQIKKLQQGSDEIKSLKSQVQQLSEKTQPNKGGFLNKLMDRRGSQPQNKRLQIQLIETKKKVTELQNTIKKINAQKENIKKQHQKILTEKQNQLMQSIQSTNINLQFKNKEIKFKTNENRLLQDQIKNLHQKCKQQEQLTKEIQQNCQQKIEKRFREQINSLEDRVNQLSKEIQNGNTQKQAFASQLLSKLDAYMKPKGK